MVQPGSFGFQGAQYQQSQTIQQTQPSQQFQQTQASQQEDLYRRLQEAVSWANQSPSQHPDINSTGGNMQCKYILLLLALCVDVM